MANFFSDNADILFHMKTMDLARVIELREDGFHDAQQFAYAARDAADARDSYERVLTVLGEIAGDYIAPRAAEVDRIGAHCADGVVTYAPGTAQALKRLAEADMMGMTLPRRYGGLNFPKTAYSIAIEMVSRGDAALMNIFGLQDIAETILKFGSEEQRQANLPRFAAGQITGAMDLTEPDAGSDLQAVMLKATENEDGTWRLNGVKRFITNGCAGVHLVLARSEEGSTDGRGLSLFVYDSSKGGLRIRRIEEKMGIHGSPTTELQFTNAPAQLLGRRRAGLIKYTMSLMNGARLGIAAQSVGIAEAAYRCALDYAKAREQFKKPIIDIWAVKEMVRDMEIDVQAGRTLLYETSRIVDIKESIEEIIEHHPERKNDLNGDLRRYGKLADLMTPLCKAFNTEMCNRVAYNGIQVHGGVGFTKEFDAERHYRDARITNIYEGTTQLQVVAAIGGVAGGTLIEYLASLDEEQDWSKVSGLIAGARAIRAEVEAALGLLKTRADSSACVEHHARRLVDMAADAVIAHLMTRDANHDHPMAAAKKANAQWFIAKALAKAKGTVAYIQANPTRPE